MRIVVLGGYGHFGGRICRSLVAERGWDLIVAGRDSVRGQRFVAGLGATRSPARAVVLDAQTDDLAARLAALAPGIVIHSAGPFQGRDYRVAEACLAAGAHCIDLADGRDFVAGIGCLDARARGGTLDRERRQQRSGTERGGGRSTAPASSGYGRWRRAPVPATAPRAARPRPVGPRLRRAALPDPAARSMARGPRLAVAAPDRRAGPRAAVAGALRGSGPVGAAGAVSGAGALRLPRRAGAAAHALRPVAGELASARGCSADCRRWLRRCWR